MDINAEFLYEPAYLNDDSRFQHSLIDCTGTEKEYRPICGKVCELSDHSLVTVYHKLHLKGRDRAVDFTAPTTIWSKKSYDGGLTWCEARLLVDLKEDRLGLGDEKYCAGGAQAPGLLKLHSGELLLNCCRVHSKSSTTMELYRSTDDGKNFVEEKPIWEVSENMRLQGGLGSLVQLASGRILCAFHEGKGERVKKYNDGQKNYIGCFYSDDMGKSWRLSESSFTLDKRGAMEPSIAVLKDGSLIMAIRTQLGYIYLSTSNNDGLTWSEPYTSGLEAPEAPMFIKAIPDTNDIIILYCGGKFEPEHHHMGERRPLKMAISRDRGENWDILGEIAGDNTHEFGANDIFFNEKGEVLIVYNYIQEAWKRTTANLRFARIDNSWLYKNI